MNSKDLDKFNLDLRQFFDFDNHRQIYHIHIWKRDFTFRDMRTAARHSEIAERFETAISWIRQIEKIDRPTCCPDCGAEDPVPKVLQFSVITGEEDVFRHSYDDLNWPDMVRWLKWAVGVLRQLSHSDRAAFRSSDKLQQQFRDLGRDDFFVILPDRRWKAGWSKPLFLRVKDYVALVKPKCYEPLLPFDCEPSTRNPSRFRQFASITQLFEKPLKSASI